MASHDSISCYAQHLLAERLRADPWFSLHRVKFVEQNSEELSFLIRQKLEQLEGPVCVIGTDAERNDYPAVEVDVSFNVTEVIPTNRERQGFVTAIQVAEAIVDVLDGDEWHWNEDIRHEVPKEGGGILVARTSFRGLLERSQMTEVDPTGN